MKTTHISYNRYLVILGVLFAFVAPAGAASMLDWSLVFGGSGDDWGTVKTDAAGNIYICGDTDSNDLPADAGAFDTSFNGQRDCFVAKYDASRKLLWCTYIGGTGTEECDDFAVMDDGTIYMLVTSDSTDFPQAQSVGTAEDVIIVKLAADGKTLSQVRRIGGTGGDDAVSMHVGSATGGILICGDTYSTDFPTTVGAWDTHLNTGSKAFVIKLDNNLETIYSTLLGGTGYTYTVDMVGSGDGSAILAGTTNAADFPTTADAYDKVLDGLSDVFITKINAAGTGLVFSTFLGSSKIDSAGGISLDPNGNIYIAGGTGGADFPVTTGVYDPTFNGGSHIDDGDAYLALLDANGANLLRSTFFGGTYGDDMAKSIMCDDGGIYFAGSTWSNNFPITANAFDPNYNGTHLDCDGFAGMMDAAMTTLKFSSFIGSSDIDSCMILKTGAVLWIYGQVSAAPGFTITNGRFHGANDIYVAAVGNISGNEPRISGCVKNAAGVAMPGVALKCDSTAATATTDADGRYSLAVASGWSGKVIASRTDHVFTPANIAYTNVTDNIDDQNFTGELQIAIAGYIKTSGQTAISGVTVSAGTSITAVTTNSAGYYRLLVPSGFSGTITAAKSGFTCFPKSVLITAISTNKTQNFTGYVMPAISGYVKTSAGRAVSGVTVSGNNGAYAAKTNTAGFYAVKVPYQWTGKITCTGLNLSFVPASKAYTAVTASKSSQNFVAYSKPAVQGRLLTSSGKVMAGITIKTTNGGGSTVTNSTGYYTLRVPYKWTGKVVPSSSLYTFVPGSRAYTSIISNKTAQNFTGYVKPTISGYLKTRNGTAIAGAVITAAAGGSTTITSATGYYALRVPYKWTGKLVASSSLYTFVPGSRTYTSVTSSKTGQNFSGYVKPTISGYIKTSKGVAVAGVTVASDTGGGTAKTNTSGYYAMRVPYNWTGKVVARKTGSTFTPAYRAYSKVTASKTSQNFVRKL